MCLVCLLCVFLFYEVTSDYPSLKLPYNNYIYFPIFILEKEPVFPFLFSALNKRTTGTIFLTSLV